MTDPVLHSIPLSALQHYLYCPRQCALIHLECQWEDNQFTAEGTAFHERADSGLTETRRLRRTLRSLHLSSDHWGIHGIADVVEVTYESKSRLPVSMIPVEYKVGKPKSHRADEVQVCAQALCLEEMFNIQVSSGFLFYGKTRRKHDVMFDEELRALTVQVIREARQILTGMDTPAPRYSKSCKSCSLIHQCLPSVCKGWSSRVTQQIDHDFEESLNTREIHEL